MKRREHYWKPSYVVKKSLVQPKLSFKPYFRLNLDTDRDGVPDWKDCEPFNYWKQHNDDELWRCNRCGGYFSYKNRLPESHHCP